MRENVNLILPLKFCDSTAHACNAGRRNIDAVDLWMRPQGLQRHLISIFVVVERLKHIDQLIRHFLFPEGTRKSADTIVVPFHFKRTGYDQKIKLIRCHQRKQPCGRTPRLQIIAAYITKPSGFCKIGIDRNDRDSRIDQLIEKRTDFFCINR